MILQELAGAFTFFDDSVGNATATALFEHCSILHYIESLFLRGRYLTARDCYARNIGSYLIDLNQAPHLDAAGIVGALPRPLLQSGHDRPRSDRIRRRRRAARRGDRGSPGHPDRVATVGTVCGEVPHIGP
ncbi:MAG TPA: hypothetical protein VKH41_13935 [Myxococcota bacterium]|nr:hypothetical protein [Myxococcota bacterium]